MARARNWCFTLNNPEDDEVAFLRDCVGDTVTYVCWGDEVGEGGTPHLQGYAEFGRVVSMRQVKRALGSDRFHLEARRGTQAQAIEYCQKDGAFTEMGVKKAQGRRTDLHRLADVVAASAKPEHVAHELPAMYIKFHKGIRELHRALRFNPAWPGARTGADDIEVIYVWGPTATGKTRWCREQCDPDDIFTKTHRSDKWWCGYAGHPVVILDEFRESYAFSEILQILDRYPYTVEYKGGMTSLDARTFYITSDKPPEEQYRGVGEERQRQFLRRLTRVVEFPIQ